MSYLQNDNALLESRQKELQGTIQNLLQSRENFINAYEVCNGALYCLKLKKGFGWLYQFDGFEQESTCEMKRAIKARDQKLNVLSEKLNSHLTLIDSIEKESISIKQLMNNVQCLVSEKEEVGM